MDILTIIIIMALSTYELTDLLVYQDGPYEIFKKIRNYFGLYELADGTKYIDNEKQYIFSKWISTNDYNLIANVLSCPYCTKIWVMIGVIILALINIKILIPLAALGIMTVILDLKG